MSKYYKDGIEATEGEVKALHPNVIFCPTTMSEFGWVVIFDTPQPIITELQVAYQDGTEIDSKGNRVVKWTIQPKFATVAEETAYLTQLQADAQVKVVEHFVSMTDAFIQSKITAYNVANNLAFKDIDSFTKYAVNTASPYNAIANQFIAYADKVWMAMRTYLNSGLTSIPTDIQFKAILDGVVF